MKNLAGKLPLIAFVVAAFAAVAFTSPEQDSEYWAIIDGQFQNVTTAVENNQYMCDTATSGHCLYDAENGNPISEPETKYVPL